MTITRDDGSQVERHHHDNRLAMQALARLDRLADAPAPGAAAAASAVPADAAAARLVAQDWDGFLALVEEERGPARAALFLAHRSGEVIEAVVGMGAGGGAAATLEPVAALARADLRLRTGAGCVAEIDTVDLDADRRADWTAEQWARAEAAGLVQLAPVSVPEEAGGGDGDPQPPQHSGADDPAGSAFGPESIWWDEAADDWRTDFPPPPGFAGEEQGAFGEDGYWRTVDAEEEAVLIAVTARADAAWLADGLAARERWLAATRAELSASAGETWPLAA